MDDPTLALGKTVWEALDRMVRQLLARKPGAHLIEGRLEPLDVRLVVGLGGPAADSRSFAERLRDALDRQLVAALQRAAAFRPGNAYCHRCRAAACEHSRPPSSRHTFVAYSPTGVPQWQDFAQHCLDIKHPRVDQLYDESPALITLLGERQALHGGLLSSFEDRSHELLGQLAAGFFALPRRAEEGRAVVAVTIQVAVARGAGGAPRLGLNVLGLTPAGEDLGVLWERREPPWQRAVRWAQAAIETVNVSRPARGGPRGSDTDELERRALGILQGLARRLAQGHRSRGRRTLHAAERHDAGDRPTRKAIDDARVAPRESVLIDEQTGTVVVLGPRGRTHFFSPAGQHVSSVRYSGEAIARKRKLERWRQASAEEREAFGARLPP